MAIVLGAIALMLMAGSLAIAKIAPRDPPEDAFERASILNDIVDEAALPLPVIGDRLFVTKSDLPQCVDRQAVDAQFRSDAVVIGGRTIEISDASAQTFADRWRDSVSVERAVVTGIVAHLFLDGGTDEWTADLVELDETGCAMSRTLISVFTLNALFAAADDAAKQ